MLKFFMRIFYKKHIYTDEPELFYELYKWNSGLYTLLVLRSEITITILGLIIIISSFTSERNTIPMFFCSMFFLILAILYAIEIKKKIKYNVVGLRTPYQIRTIKLRNFIRKFVSQNGKALGRKEWKEIKKTDIGLYNDLLCDECEGVCYFYSLEIARIIKDSILIWGGVEDPFKEGHDHYAHAIVLRNGYIYDSNMRQSEKYEDFIKLYKFKAYKQWKYDEYSKKDFRKNERAEFRKWCKENNVLVYEKF